MGGGCTSVKTITVDQPVPCPSELPDPQCREPADIVKGVEDAKGALDPLVVTLACWRAEYQFIIELHNACAEAIE